MQPSSLIFVVVVAIWAVYLLQYWARRRDHMATIRSVDRFSEAMRVLDHRRLNDPTPEPAPRSYAVTPTRAARPQVTVKRAGAPGPVAEPELRHDREAADMTSLDTQGRPRLVSAFVTAPRKYRGLAFLGHLVLLPVTLLVAALGPLPWLVPLLVLLGTAGAFGWLRQGVMAERAAARAARPVRQQHASAARPAATAPAARPVRRTTVTVEDAPAEPTQTGPTQAEVYDVDEAQATAEAQVLEDAPTPGEAVAEQVVAQAESQAPADDTWEPVPVPRPTYTMKARAVPVTPVPAAPVPVSDADMEALPALDDDVVAPAPRRVANG